MIVANLYNNKTNRFHPIAFEEYPLPGNNLNIGRSKSIGHHTIGFDHRDDAIIECKRLVNEQHAKLYIVRDFKWDDEGIPAMIVFFTERDDELVAVEL